MVDGVASSSSPPEQAIDNAKAADVTLTEDELVEMDRISRPVIDLIDDNPVQWKW